MPHLLFVATAWRRLVEVLHLCAMLLSQNQCTRLLSMPGLVQIAAESQTGSMAAAEGGARSCHLTRSRASRYRARPSIVQYILHLHSPEHALHDGREKNATLEAIDQTTLKRRIKCVAHPLCFAFMRLPISGLSYPTKMDELSETYVSVCVSGNPM